MASKPPIKKRIYLVNRDFQLKYVKLAILVGLISTLLTSVVILYPLFEFRMLRFPNFMPAPFLWAMAFAAVVNLVTVACFGILITHRIAGPMFSLVRHMRTLVQTNSFSAELKVRDSDDLKYVVRNFNEFVAHIRGLVESDRKQLRKVIESIRTGGEESVRNALETAELLERDLSARAGDPK